jgi:hypothetical protein
MASAPPGYTTLEGSERHPAPDAKRLGPADPAEEFSVTVRVRRRPDAPPLPDHAHWIATPPLQRKFITHQEFARKFGAAQEDLDAVAEFARGHGLSVEETSVAGRTVRLSGTVEQMSGAFGVELGRYQGADGVYRGRDGFIHVPRELDGIVLAVFGLDNRRVGFRNANLPPGTTTFAVGGPTLVGQFYNFPQAPPDASGQRIGVLEFTTPPGGWNKPDVTATLTTWFATNTSPTIIDVPSSGGNSANSDSETILDVCTASAIAPNATIQVYWGADSTTAQDWFNIIDRIFHNPKAGDPPHPQVLTISWTLIGGDDFITPGGVVSTAVINEISSDFKDMAFAGITVLVASGDGGSLGWNNTTQAMHYPGALGHPHVAYPASDPWVTACGGTVTGQTPMATLGQEWLWNDDTGATGGGISQFFTALPPWQAGIVSQKLLMTNAVGRGVPDVAGNASLDSGYLLTLNGMSNQGPYCGTSAVAPLYAGLVAMINARMALSSGMGFLNPTLYAFRDSVCLDINNKTFPGAPADNSFGGSPGYPSGPGWDACTGLGRIDGGALLAAVQGVYQKDCQFILDRTEFGKAEVSATLPGPTPGVIANAFYVVVDGFSASDLGIKSSDLFPNTPTVVPALSSSVAGLTIAATALLAEDVTLPPTPQRFTWVCSANFKTDLSAFVTVPTTANLKASMMGQSGSATIALVAQADPYELDGATPWLSTDLRVFQMPSGGSLPGLPNVMLQGTDAPKFIQQVIAGFNANMSAPPNHPFDSISTDEAVSQVTLNQFLADGTTPVFNFAVARVRYESNAASSKVRVFFRLYRAATSSTAFEPQTYAAVSNAGASMSGLIPVFGVDAGGNLVAIPCFAVARAAAGTMLNTQTDDSNVLLSGIQPGAGGGVAYAYFGCWLDINQTASMVPVPPVPADSIDPWMNGSQSILSAIAGQHQCLISEISYDADPVTPGQTPASSDKLAQRNLMIVSSANPGNPASHRIPHTLDLRPTPAALSPHVAADELMIQWGNVPAGSTATIYVPGVSAQQVLDAATRLYPREHLTKVDDHTLRCPAAGVTWMPIPRGAKANLAALLTVDLPPTVRKGEVYKVVARQVTSSVLADVGRGQRERQGGAVGTFRVRRVLGSFQLTIPVSTEEALLEPEERLLAIMRWIEQEIPPHDRWLPVISRYVRQIAERVRGFGGDPGKILPSPSGSIPLPTVGKHHDLEFTGKVTGLVYDRFGEFEGFLVLSYSGHERSFRSTEQEVESLIRRAWDERITLTVFFHHSNPHTPVSIVLRRPPRHLEH